MSLLFRPSPHDQEALRSAVRSLRETTVAGLAAALSWRTRKVERLLVDELTRNGTMLAYDPARRVIRWAPPVSAVWEAPAPVASPAASLRPAVDLGPALAAPPPVLRSGGLRSQCPSCHVELVASTASSLNVCPQCGRLFSSRVASGAETDQLRASPPPSEPSTSRSTVYSERLSQELLAAYVTARPIPCPRCRTSLRHKGVSEYACPSCGETVRFGSGGIAASTTSVSRSSASAPPTIPAP